MLDNLISGVVFLGVSDCGDAIYVERAARGAFAVCLDEACPHAMARRKIPTCRHGMPRVALRICSNNKLISTLSQLPAATTDRPKKGPTYRPTDRPSFMSFSQILQCSPEINYIEFVQ